MVSWLDRPEWSRDRAIIVHIRLENRGANREVLYLQHEFSRLAEAGGFNRLSICNIHVRTIDPKYFIGRGKVLELRALAAQEKASILLIDAHLTGTQERHLESLIGCRILDRTGLILDIFAQRAHSREGVLQVQLAQYQYAATRVVHGWTHLERQAGAAQQRGPGEQQVELDRRLIQRKIKGLKEQLTIVHRQRQQSRVRRLAFRWPILALVGYTNAGKSTLFERLTEAPSHAGDQLFMTLDPKTRRFNVRGKRLPIFISDTVGFIRDLPHELVSAFRATLLEVKEADLLLRVEDGSDPMQIKQRDAVDRVLEEIGALSKPQLWISNKMDVGLKEREDFVQRESESLNRLEISARSGHGMDELVEAIIDQLHAQVGLACYRFQFKENEDRSACIAACYRFGWVEHFFSDFRKNTITIGVWQTQAGWEKLRAVYPNLIRHLVQVGTVT